MDFHKALFWIMSPLFLLQAIYLRKTAIRLPEPQGPREGITGNGSALKLLVVGDSAGAGVGCRTQCEALAGQICRALAEQREIHWTVFAKTGWTSRDLLNHLHEIPAQKFDVVVTSLGVNDLTGLVPSDTWILQQEVLTWRLRERFENPLICFSGIAPIGQFPALPHPLRWWLGRQAARLSEHLKEWCEAQVDCRYIHLVVPFTQDMMASDGFHPGPAIYSIWGDLVAKEIRT